MSIDIPEKKYCKLLAESLFNPTKTITRNFNFAYNSLIFSGPDLLAKLNNCHNNWLIGALPALT